MVLFNVMPETAVVFLCCNGMFVPDSPFPAFPGKKYAVLGEETWKYQFVRQVVGVIFRHMAIFVARIHEHAHTGENPGLPNTPNRGKSHTKAAAHTHTPLSRDIPHNPPLPCLCDKKQLRAPRSPGSAPIISTARQRINALQEGRQAVVGDLCRCRLNSGDGRALPTASGCGVGHISSRSLGAARTDRRGGVCCQSRCLLVVASYGLIRWRTAILLVERVCHRLLQPHSTCVDKRERREPGKERKGEGCGVFAGRGSPRGWRVSVHYQGERASWARGWGALLLE